jgi:aminopeptidase
MAETLFDENISGPFGNMHLALGSAYDDCYTGDLKKFTSPLRHQLGFNNSVIHTDIITTADRTVTAFLSDGSSKAIYENGQFTV